MTTRLGAIPHGLLEARLNQENGAAGDVSDARYDRVQIGIHLLDQSCLFVLAACLEVLHRANSELGVNFFHPIILGHESSSESKKFGCWQEVKSHSKSNLGMSTLLIIGSEPSSPLQCKVFLPQLRFAHRHGATLVGIGSGVFPIAEAGLLTAQKCCVDNEYLNVFRERFPEISISQRLFHSEGQLVTCAGGTAVIDMMLWLIGRKLGNLHVSSIARGLQIGSLRNTNDDQICFPGGYGTVSCPRVRHAMKLFEEHIEEPMHPSAVAERLSISPRQLQRLFRRHLGESPARYSKRLRLKRARHLIQYSDLSVVDISLMCGFSSPSHMSKSYTDQYGIAPAKEFPRGKLQVASA